MLLLRAAGHRVASPRSTAICASRPTTPRSPRATIALGRAGIGITALVPHTATLEELFLVMTGGESADTEAAA